MTTIDLQCPGCETLLELDRGFAGGVCRCSDCGTLMTVPDSAADRPERLERPDAPVQPQSRPDSPSKPSRRASTTRTKPTRSRSREPEPKGKQTYRTASGRTITVDHDRVIPMAPVKRHAVRAATVLVFVAVVGGVLGLCGFGVYLMWSRPDAKQVAEAQYVETFQFDPDANPYTIAAPHVLGLPLTNRVAVVYDTTTLTADQLASVNPLLLDGLRRGDPAVAVTLIANRAQGELDTLLDERPLDRVDTEALRRDLADLTANAAGSPLISATQRALNDDPEVLILVTARRVDQAEARAVANLLPPSGVRLDAVMIDADSFALEDLTREHGGHYVTLASDQELADWQP